MRTKGELAEWSIAAVLEHAQPAPVKANLLAGYAGAKTVYAKNG